jgi:hypothetical protein
MTLVRSVMLAALVARAGFAEPTALRPPHPEEQSVGRARNVQAPTEEPAGPERWAARNAVQTASVSPEQKEALFRDFDDYLRRSGDHHADTSARASTSARPAASTSRPRRHSSHRRRASLNGGPSHSVRNHSLSQKHHGCIGPYGAGCCVAPVAEASRSCSGARG